ncbi:helix-turn-helix domain-containing protein [Streptomyces geysiriensis]|uniref:helix-turn-helix domain-containing protein n=1 Tax=Streptomyces geysiriensis TaxID=68207 RepID=UPI0035AB9124
MTHRSGPEHGLLVLARELAVLRARTGLSLDALARRTTASRSSWHRYLNGTLLPPRALVQELCALADEPPGRLLALWDLAAEPGGPPPPPPPPSEPSCSR